MRIRRNRQGAALLSVLWLTAAMTAIAFSVASSVRGELDRATTHADGARAYFLARGALERYLHDAGRGLRPATPWVRYSFPEGDAIIEVIPETSKLHLNSINEEDLVRMLLALGVPPDRAAHITRAVVDWRTPLPAPNVLSPFDAIYAARQPSFQAPHASFQETEELLLVDGVTRELFHGGYERLPDGRFAPRPGLKDCLSVYGGRGSADVWTAPLPVLAAIGLPPQAAGLVLDARRSGLLADAGAWLRLQQALGPAGSRLVRGGRSLFTIRASARLRQQGRLSDTRRTIAALIKFAPRPAAFYDLLRWDDQAIPAGDLAW